MNAVEIWTRNTRETRKHFRAAREKLYERWLNSNMDIIERDRLMAALNSQEDACIATEQRIYIANREGVSL